MLLRFKSRHLHKIYRMKLEDFYRQTVIENENQTRGWSCYYYGVLTKVINENNYKNVVEVGIGYGLHAKYILKTTNLDKLTLVDPMKYYPNDMFASDIMSTEAIIPGNNFNEMYDLINKELSPYKERYTWLRTESQSVTDEMIPNGSVDCVFVDGDHSYDAVLKDLDLWWKKVREGGQMLGDDYWMDDVSTAVGDFAKLYNLKFDFLYKEGTDYKIYRFQKPKI